MFAKVDLHWVNEGMMEAAQASIAERTASAKRSAGFISRYVLMSTSDPLKVTTVALWETREAMEKWREAARVKSAKNPRSGPSPWAKIDGDEYDVLQQV